MTPDIYLVWYKEDKSALEHTAGFAYTWVIAEQMAKDLYSIKRRIEKSKNVSTGISLLQAGSLYTITAPTRKWQILPLLSILTFTR